MMAMAAGTVKGEFQSVLFGSTGPVVSSLVDIKIMYEIARTGHAFNQKKLEEITVRQMTIDTLSRKTLGVLAAMNRLLPRRPEGCHDMTTNTKRIGIGGFNHKTRSKHRYDR